MKDIGNSVADRLKDAAKDAEVTHSPTSIKGKGKTTATAKQKARNASIVAALTLASSVSPGSSVIVPTTDAALHFNPTYNAMAQHRLYTYDAGTLHWNAAQFVESDFQRAKSRIIIV